MMKTSKLLININKISEMDEYKRIGDVNFLFAVKDYSIGYQEFSLDEIPNDAYLLMNRVCDTTTIDNLKKIIPELKKYKGIIFEDVGMYQTLKDTSIPLIWFQNHFGTNIDSINFWLDKGCVSAFISNEITESEIVDIVNDAHKPLVLNVLGKNQIMYSRRKLISNFNTFANLNSVNDVTLKNRDNVFFAHETEYGTVLFNNNYFNYLGIIDKLNDDNIMFYYVANLDMEPSEVIDIINGAHFGDEGFLNKKTVYKMAEYNDR